MKLKNTPRLETPRLILRPFAPSDAEAFFAIMADPEANTFLPWHPAATLEQAVAQMQEQYLRFYQLPRAYRYAVCLKTDDRPIGYVAVSNEDSHDLGYGLRREFWHQGIVSEAALAVVETLKQAGYPYITATHDVKNLRSGAVMQRLGMKYCYSYVEQWQPKNFPVTFRMYQLNLDGDPQRVYTKYWEQATQRFVETF